MKNDRAEALVQVLILLAIAGMAGAASFTHVHDWTMRNAPAGTGTWFGWANAVISDLTPTAAGIEIRRRKRHGHTSVAYPMTVLIAAALFSLTAQVADARPTPAGWITAAVPALAFLALTKLILSRQAVAHSANPRSQPAAPPRPADAAATTAAGPEAEPGRHLLTSARMAAFAHQQATGQPITAGQLADRIGIPVPLAGTVLHNIGGTTPPPVTAVNGTPAAGGNRP